MAVGSGIGSQLSVGEETTFGTAATLNRHVPVKSFKVALEAEDMEIAGLAAGRAAAFDNIRTTRAGVAEVEMPAWNRGLGVYLRQIFGGTVAPVQQAATTAYLQSLVLTDPRGRMLSIQGGLPDTGGTARPYTALGAKCTGLEISCAKGEIATLKWEFASRDISEATGLATASYTSPISVFNWSQLGVKLGTFGSEATVQGVRGFSLKLSRPLDLDGSFYAGNAGLRSEPNWNAHMEVSGTIDIDYVTKADFVDRYLANTSTAMVIEFVGPIIASTFAETLRFRVPKAFFGGEIPAVPDNGVLKASVPFMGRLDLTNGLVTCDYMSLDTTI